MIEYLKAPMAWNHFLDTLRAISLYTGACQAIIEDTLLPGIYTLETSEFSLAIQHTDK
jgi:hypothetical protein